MYSSSKGDVAHALCSICFSEGQVLRGLSPLTVVKVLVYGVDGIPSVFAANYAHQLSVPLSLIFVISLSTGIFPSLRKLSLIVSVHKAGDVSHIINYRPITTLSVFAKLLESLLCPYVSWHIKSVLTDFQHVFASARSTTATTNLEDFFDDIFHSLDERTVHVIYIDLSKAFDKVPHSILFHKWCSSYLSDRTSKVVVGGYESDLFYKYILKPRLTLIIDYTVGLGFSGRPPLPTTPSVVEYFILGSTYTRGRT